MKRAFLALALCAGAGATAFADPPSGDGAPAGMVTFFNGAGCPSGWTAASVAEGRLVLGVTSGVYVGVQVGKKLAPVEDRAHAHTYSASITLAVKSVSAAGGPNDSAAAAQAYPIAGATGAAATGLPFIQLRACERKP